VKKKTDNTQDETLRSSGKHIQDTWSGVNVFVNLAKLNKHRVAPLKELEEYLAHVKCEELAMSAILLGREFKNSERYFAGRAKLFYDLRESLSACGRKCKIAVVDEAGNGTTYHWTEFCLKFWGVGDHSIRNQLCRFNGLNDEPNIDPQLGEDDDPEPDRQEAELDAEENIERAQQISTRLELDNRTVLRWTTVRGDGWTWRGLTWSK
jgi:hypothetical protein